MNNIDIHLQTAQRQQVNEIADLVNKAYRGEIGWMKETRLVQGERCTQDEILGYLSNPHAYLLVV
ncbi:MAG: hypothetical protein L3J38_03510 [Thiomicrorhabdus sp.]|nr:hypothetical protein [Thiomicrorhabdus sp.]